MKSQMPLAVQNFLFFFLFCLGYIQTVSAEIEITHDPVEESLSGARINFKAEVEDGDHEISSVRIYFKSTDDSRYYYVTMSTGGDNEYTGVLPAPAAGIGSINYFLLAKNDNDDVIKSQNFTIFVEDTSGAQDASGALVVDASEFRDVDGYHGKIVRAEGTVLIVTANGEKRTPAQAGNVVLETETVETGPDSRAAIDFDKDPFTVLDSDSQLRIKQLGFFAHLAGQAYFSFKKIFGATTKPRTVTNLVASIGIRGTTFLSRAESGYAMKEGSVELFPEDPQNSSSLMAGRETTLDANGNLVEGPITAESLATISRLETFGGILLGGALIANASSASRIAVSVEGGMPQAIKGFETLDIVASESTAPLGASATTSTTVATTTTATTTGIGAVGIAGSVAGVAVVAGATASGGSSSGGDPPELCNVARSGTNQPGPLVVELGRASGQFNVTFLPFDVADRMLMTYEGGVLFDSGCVSGTAATTEPIAYSGSDTDIAVDILTDCAGDNLFSAWEFTIACQ